LINFFTTQSVPVQFFILLAHAVLVLAASIGCMRWLGSRLRGRNDIIPVAPYFVSVTTLFALFLAFHASTTSTAPPAPDAIYLINNLSRPDTVVTAPD